MKLARLTSCRLALVASVISILPLRAQTTASPVTASLVPIGANSDAYWVGEGPGMKAIAIDPDAAPPKSLCIRVHGDFKVIPGILNRPSIALPVNEGLLRVFASQDAAQGEDPPLFCEFKIPATPGHYDIFLNRSQAKKGWESPESMVLPSNTTVFQPGSFRFINLCGEPIQAKIGPTVFTLAPRKAKITAQDTGISGKLISVQALHANGKELRAIIRTGIRLKPGQRANIVFYPGRDAKKPCLSTWFYQSPPEVEPEKKSVSND